ncbi:MAG: SRPBCC family protein [Bryobacteraceae bacterium]
MIKTVIHIESPRPFVFEVFTQYANYRHWLPGCEKSDVASANGNVTDLDLTVNSMKRMSMTLRFEANPPQVLNFSMTKGSELKAYEGSYRLMDSADGRGTVVMAELDIDAGALAPKFLVDRMAKKAVEETGAALKKYIQTLPPPSQQAVASSAAPQKGVAKRLTRGKKKVLEIVRTPGGYRIWYLGRPYVPSQ